MQPADIAPRVDEFRRRYGLDRSRFFGSPAMNLRVFVLNTSRPLFRNNLKLRQAVNFAVDRRAILRERGPLSGYLTDQYLPTFSPGFRNEHIYPLKGPDLARARALATGHTRSGKVVIYVSSTAPESLPQGQVLAANLKRIGLDAEIKSFPSPVLFPKMRTPDEPFDIGWVGWINILPPGETILNWMFDGRSIAHAPDFGDLSYFNSPHYNRLLERASRLPYGPERQRAFAALDVDLARNAAPAIALAYDRNLILVSARTGCVVVNPFLDLTAVCLK
jgi:peptide/nickel transport system substrate-binding protein/oligopeptide transport system substrate-binding protein